jgi:hypothetical protein
MTSQIKQIPDEGKKKCCVEKLVLIETLKLTPQGHNNTNLNIAVANRITKQRLHIAYLSLLLLERLKYYRHSSKNVKRTVKLSL